ncbi:RDD family protein [Draconibacterium sp. IB214405]|uniref:RDD family protein n=1 Tax=Draconibacterium sp. IB214405 TaxID=3097352 RepID=UPI002A146795|nr:RDD family protein [Draconibacterium sp. IB214405]MDX8338850.1 RDD family protein [Draconibacterium sp. IB214405]
MENHDYPGVFVRVKAVITDSVLLLIFMLGVVSLFDLFENVPDFARIAAFVFIFLLYDPLFTSIFGGTIGHFLFGIRVKRANNPEKNILFPLALIRYLIKALLGWLSLITVSGNKKGKAIHDIVVLSIVIYKNSVGAIN